MYTEIYSFVNVHPRKKKWQKRSNGRTLNSDISLHCVEMARKGRLSKNVLKTKSKLVRGELGRNRGRRGKVWKPARGGKGRKHMKVLLVKGRVGGGT